MYEIVIPAKDVKSVLNAEWNKAPKQTHYGATDGKPKHLASKDIDAGNLGEQAVYLFCQSRDVLVSPPNFDHIDNVKGKWKDDIVTDESIFISRKSKNINCGRHISVKCQYQYRAEGYGRSWVFQKYRWDNGTGGDPLLFKPKESALFAGVIIHAGKDIRTSIKDVKCELWFFYWPDVIPLLGEMKLPQHREKKAAMYFDDIGHLALDFDKEIIWESALPKV